MEGKKHDLIIKSWLIHAGEDVPDRGRGVSLGGSLTHGQFTTLLTRGLLTKLLSNELSTWRGS